MHEPIVGPDRTIQIQHFLSLSLFLTIAQLFKAHIV